MRLPDKRSETINVFRQDLHTHVSALSFINPLAGLAHWPIL